MLAKHPLTALKGVGPKQAEKLHKLGLFVVQDLLFHLPLRYQDKTRLTPLHQGIPGEEILIEGTVLSHTVVQKRRRSLLVTLKIPPPSHKITLRFFHFYPKQIQQFSSGKTVRAFGELRSGPTGFELIHPSYELIHPNHPPPLDTTLTPIYPTTEGLRQATLLKLMQQSLALLKQYPLKELLPNELLNQLKLPLLNQALLTLHQPLASDHLTQIKQFTHPAQQRLIIEELINQQVAMQQMRSKEKQRTAPALPASPRCQVLLSQLPFHLTSAQQRVLQEIQHDLAQPHPMLRLIQGDVGSGKTIIAALSAIQAADSGYQAAIMAPTELLAEQHLEAFQAWLTPLNIQIAWLNGRMNISKKKQMLTNIQNGTAKVIIGTHALFQDSVSFHNLGLVIIDEQHRFGVHQRLSLHKKNQDKNIHTHQLIMTATPIPRTLAMSAYGDLDLSIIDELPPGRKPVKTAVLSNEKRLEVMKHLYTQCQQGIQAYWVCPLIETSESLNIQAAEATASLFSEHWPDLRIGLIHGRLNSDQKTQLMNAFKQHQLDLLVATTVIEVGVNVPNASLMVIENAERLGLAQLHQLRGRVGRGTKQSHCVLLYQPPLSLTGKARLNIMRQTTDGFKIAEEDLRLRGPGEILGTKQTGLLEFKIANLKRDAQWLPIAKQWANILITHHPEYIEALNTRWIGQNINYQNA